MIKDLELYSHEVNDSNAVLTDPQMTGPTWQYQYSKNRRILMVSCASIICLFMTGIVFGDAALRPVMIKSGIYRWLCEEGQTTCSAQELRLALMFTLASSLTSIVGLPVGIYLDKFGPRATGFDAYIASYILFGISGPAMMISSMHLINTFPKRAGAIMGLFSAAFDASAIVFFIFQVSSEFNCQFAYNSSDGSISLKAMFLVLLIVPVTAILMHIFILPKATLSSDRSESTAPAMHFKPLKKQLLSSDFVAITAYMSFMMLRMNFYISSIGRQTMRLVEEDIFNASQRETLITSFNILLPAGGAAALPLISVLLDYCPSFLNFTIICISVMLYGGFQMIKTLATQYFSIVIFSILRPLLYSAANDYCARVFGFRNFGKVYGTMILVAGLFNLLQYLLSYIATEVLNGNYQPINAVLVGLTTLTFIFPYYLWKKRKNTKL